MDFISRKDGIDKKFIKEYFNNFRQHIQEYLVKAKTFLQKPELDFTMEEIDQMGVFYKTHFKAPDNVGLNYDYMLDVFIAYCCEAWMHYFGGEYFDTVSKKDIAYGYPQVINWGPANYGWTAIAPHEWAFMIEEGDDEPLSLPFSRDISYFSKSADWNYKLKK